MIRQGHCIMCGQEVDVSKMVESALLKEGENPIISEWRKYGEAAWAAYDGMTKRYEQAHNDRAKLSVENAELRELLKECKNYLVILYNIVESETTKAETTALLQRIEEIVKEKS